MGRKDTIRVDEEFRELLPALSPDARDALQASILREGCRDPLVVWKEERILIEGHHRLEICNVNEVDYDYTEVSLPDRDATKLWMLKNARARRNLNPNQLSYFRGEEYNLEKRQGARTDLTSHQSDGKSTAERLAKEHGVGRATIERDGTYAAAVDKLAENTTGANAISPLPHRRLFGIMLVGIGPLANSCPLRG